MMMLNAETAFCLTGFKKKRMDNNGNGYYAYIMMGMCIKV